MVSTTFCFPTMGVEVERHAILLAIDDYLLPLKRNLCHYLTKPAVRAEPVLLPSHNQPDAPDYLSTSFYGAVLLDEGRFRMWYCPSTLDPNTKELTLGPPCYAESEDGIIWSKPVLGQVEFRGSRTNNAMTFPETLIETVAVIKEPDDPNPQRRYKMVYNPHHDEVSFTIRTATSPDGITWTPGPELPVQSFCEPGSFYKHNGLYVVNGQVISPWSRSEGGHGSGRQAYAFASPDFSRWLQESAESFTLPEPADPAARGVGKPYDQVHIGVGATSFGTVLVGLYAIWHDHAAPDSWFGYDIISADLGLVVSNDGLHFREPVKGYVYLAADDSPVTPVAGATHPNILCQGNGILNVGDETWIYHGRWRNTYYGEDSYSEIALATLPRDRWGALGLYPDATEGSVWSAPVVIPEGGCDVLLNADDANGMRLELADERFNLLPDYSGPASGFTHSESGFTCPVQWPQGNLTGLSGTAVRLRIHLKKEAVLTPRLYAIYLAAQ